VFLFVVFALFMGVRRFWKDVKPATSNVDVSGPPLPKPRTTCCA
jgi:citrate/tricarballylate utilization protein